MIELPAWASPASASVMPEDYGFLQRGSIGAATQRINRKGNRYNISMTYGPFPPEQGNLFVSRLLQARSEGLRIPYPLLVSQGNAGSPTVDGAGQQGTSLNITGLTRDYAIREGYRLSIENASGRHYVHTVKTGDIADALGEATIVLTEQLRHAFADGDTIHLSKPMIEGYPEGDAGMWQASADRLIGISFSMVEIE